MNRLAILFLILVPISDVLGNEILNIQTDRIENIEHHFDIFTDTLNTYTIEQILDLADEGIFKKNGSNKINFGLSPHNQWLKISIRNNLKKNHDYILEIGNPDLDIINFYLVENQAIKNSILTGELFKNNTRDIIGRNFLFKLQLEHNKVYDIFILLNNNGHAFSVPIALQEINTFHSYDNKRIILYCFLYGIIIFNIIFNFYLFYTTRKRLNFYYSLYVSFIFALFFIKDGFHYLLNAPFLESFKYIIVGLYVSFFLLFVKSFISIDNRFKKLSKYINITVVISLLVGTLYFIPAPVGSVVDVALPLIILISVLATIVIAVINLDRKHHPSILFLISYCFVFIGMFVHELKEVNILPSNLFIESSMLTSVSIECVLLTIAVLEQFRIEQNNAKKTIENNLVKIEYQNKELEFINTELEKLSLVASETNNSISIYDTRGKMEWCNQAFEFFHEISHDELAKNNKDNILDIIKVEELNNYIEQCIQNQKHSIFETRLNTKRKREVWLQLTLSPFIVRNETKKIIAIGSDITKLKKYEKDLTKALKKAEESDQLKTSFLANMSHEVRTPLNGIIGFSDLLAMPNLTDQKRQKYINTIQTNGHQLIRIMDDIVEISLIESNQLKLNLAEFHLSSVIRDCIDFFETFKTTVEKEHIGLTYELNHGDHNDILYTDPFRITQVLNNILKNSFKFSKEGNVHLETQTDDKNIVVTIEDNGIGIAPESSKKIFEMFRQNELSLSRNYGGTGLGLSISKGVIEILGGTIWLDTKYTKGARFCFTLPLSLLKTNDAKKSTEDR